MYYHPRCLTDTGSRLLIETKGLLRYRRQYRRRQVQVCLQFLFSAVQNTEAVSEILMWYGLTCAIAEGYLSYWAVSVIHSLSNVILIK